MQSSHIKDTDDTLEHVLPSYETFMNLFHCPLNGSDNIVKPPIYEESLKNTVNNNNFPDQISNYEASPVNQLDDTEESLLNNIQKLSDVNTSLKIDITLTKENSLFENDKQKQHLLYHYSPGESVFGTLKISNPSDSDIPFKFIVLSMNCKIGIQDTKGKIQCNKTLFTLYDLEATFNNNNNKDENTDPTSLNFDEGANSSNQHQVQLALKTKIIKAKTTIKIPFKFKIPEYIFDTTCNSNLTHHLKIPPSFGIDRVRFNSYCSMGEIPSHLGYEKMQVNGYPVFVKDYVPNGFYCQYSIDANVIGDSKDYSKISKNDFVSLKKLEYHFRVRASPYTETETVFYDSTKTQLNQIRRLILKEIGVLKERVDLQKAGVTNLKDQNEIINNDLSEKKPYAILSENDQLETKQYKTKINFDSKNLFLKNKGKMEINCTMKKSQILEQFYPKLLSPQLNNALNDSKFMNISCPSINLKLKYIPNNIETKPPKAITINPSLIAINFSTMRNIPFHIDNDFIFEKNPAAIQEMLQIYKIYKTHVKDLMESNHLNIPKETLNMIKCMDSISYNETPIPFIFKKQNIDVGNKWIYDINSRTYSCELDITLELDSKHIYMNPKALLPTFQTCLFSRLYKISLNIGISELLNKNVIFPITVI